MGIDHAAIYIGDEKIMVDFRLIETEVQLADDECCIIFDFGCYFPYTNIEALTFDFSLGMTEFDDYKINHRYPNKYYQTITKKYGRKVSKLGYPYIMKFNEQSLMLLCVKVGIDNDYINMIFPLQTSMTREKPISVLSFYYIFDESKFHFTSYEKTESGSGWYMHKWYGHDIENDKKCDGDVIFSTPHRVDDNSFTLIYEDVIKAYPSTLKFK